jgi:lysophospholipid acyltransferase (LPLAT)-like uncharacterized protein
MGVSASAPLTHVEPASMTGSVIAARALTKYLRRVARREAGNILDAEGRALGAADITRALASTCPDGRPILAVYWGADAVAIASLPFLEPAFLAAARGLTFLFDRTVGGHICAALVEDLGCRCMILDRAGRPERLEQLSVIMRRGGSYGFAVDGSGPYFAVGNGVATLAQALRAFVVPLAAVAQPALPWPHRSRISFPLPRCRTTAAIGNPIDGLGADRRTVVADIQAALESLGALVRRPSCGWQRERSVSP